MKTNNLFDYAEAQRRKEEGIDLAGSGSSKPWVESAIAYIRSLNPGKEVTSDDIRAVMPPLPRPNAMGPVFSRAAKGGLLEKTGRWVKTARPEAHGRDIPVWKRI